MKHTRLQSIHNQTTLHASGLDDPPTMQDLARLVSHTLDSRHLATYVQGGLKVRQENKQGEMVLLFDTRQGAVLQKVCQWYLDEAKNQKNRRV